MTRHEPRFAALILAAGSGTRFSDRPAEKLLARLDGRPLLEHVLSAVRAFGPIVTVVVLGRGADEIEATVDWAMERRVRNPAPERGIASSLQLGIRVLAGLPLDPDGVFVVLGDQPWLLSATLSDLAAAVGTVPADRVMIVPVYSGDPGPRNPVLLLRAGWDLVASLDGDRGLGRIIDAYPELVHRVSVSGAMPDVDRREDLDRLRTT